MASFEGKDYYEILGVPRDATADAIRTAYRSKARKLHPDVNKADDAAEQFAKVQEAYDILSDDEKKAAYDNFLRYGFRAGGSGDGRQWQGGGTQVDPSEFASIFEQIMGGARSRSAGPDIHFDFGNRTRVRQPRSRPQRGANRQHTMTVSFMEAARGGSQQLRLGRDGSTETIDVKIPRGVEHGAKLRLRGKGAPGTAGGGAGDLILTVEVGSHPFFRREGLDILLDVPVTIAEATLGATVTVPLLQGSVDLRIPAGSSSGRRLRIRGKGIDTGSKQGDFYAVVQIVAPDPDMLDADGRAAIETLGKGLENPRETVGWSDRNG